MPPIVKLASLRPVTAWHNARFRRQHLSMGRNHARASVSWGSSQIAGSLQGRSLPRLRVQLAARNQAYREARNSVYREVRGNFRKEWKEYYALKRSGR